MEHTQECMDYNEKWESDTRGECICEGMSDLDRLLAQITTLTNENKKLKNLVSEIEEWYENNALVDEEECSIHWTSQAIVNDLKPILQKYKESKE